MKFFVYTSILLLIKTALCEEKYEFKIMGNSIKNDILELPNKSKFNIFEGKGAFTDNRGNIGDFSSRGVRQTDEEGVLIKLTAVLVLKTNDGSEIWAYPTRVKSELQVGAGYFDIFHSTGNLKNLYGKKCQYGLTVTRDKSFVMQGFCK
jgi:hypothetical protein|tara:strand:+ start:815 stop:1261 length:447 start_codon:yes stop_codon:yes gene_type:complete